MKILGIDPGLTATGFGIIEFNHDRYVLINEGVITSLASDSYAKRLKKIFSHLQNIIEKEKPDQAAIEDMFVSNNARSALKLGHARGVLILGSALSHLEVFEYSPLAIKSALTGYGRADKNQIYEMVKRLLKINKISSIHSSDALAVAICHANTHCFQQKISKENL